MSYWEFVSDGKLFSLQLPGNWSEYDDGDDGVFAFFNTEKWSGNLRITHLYVANTSDEGAFLSTVDQKWMAEKDAVFVKLNNWQTAFYINEAKNDLIVHNWVTGRENDLFICSFTFDKSFHNADWHNNELITVAEILGSIKTHEHF